MTIERTVENDGKLVTITLGDRFDFSCHREFTQSYRDLAGDEEFVVNMKYVNYMDSSALGMLLVLREHMGDDTARVRMSNCSEAIRDILEIANFQELFAID